MRYALHLAERGTGFVEPNPQVGAVIVNERGEVLGAGWHEKFGGPHAEVQALAAAGSQARGATLYVTLEPCAHFGKTPPCAAAVIAAGIRSVFVGLTDPFPLVAGRGIQQLRDAGIEVQVGLLADEVARLNAPFLKLVQTGLPYVHAKWAMSLDGKIAARTGASQWISNSESRRVVHELRGRMDAILVGIGTALADDPLLTARPPGSRTPVRVVVDSQARLPLTSQLVKTARDVPVLMVVTAQARGSAVSALRDAGVEVWASPSNGRGEVDLAALLREFGERKFTNVLVEGGSRILGALLDGRWIDAAHVFIAPLLLGGTEAPSAMGGTGWPSPAAGLRMELVQMRQLAGDVYLHGTLHPASDAPAG